ncbi:MAG: serine/threonine-protein kinase [Thermoanaerobaculia bacterium]
MNAKRWQRVKSILEDARELPHQGRRVWLAEACGGDAELQRDVESFLEHEDRLEGFIEEPVLSFLGEEAEALDERAVGRCVGPYRLARLLGKGGMGAVYLAEREQDFEQRVALKLLRRGLADRQAIRRFEAERQILARLEHPNIARLLDGGTTADGTPYFVMELVDGEPIDRYCDRHRLSIRARLELCLEVCSALEVAHQSLVIHRDLKPGNILVDVSGRPKLLDFGIAKLLRADGSAPAVTGTAPQAMTLRYASPEQLRGEPIGTASDVYSLGVVLYQLLTGELPCGLDELSHFELMRAVCEEDPRPPSNVISSRSSRRRLAGDVDSIVLKALRKEPRQRYASIERLAADIRRHLDGLPVLARQGSFAYRARKFVRRHRLGLASLTVILVLAVVFSAALVRQLRQTERQRDRAESTASFLVELFQAADPDRPGGGEPTVRELVDRGRELLRSGLEDEPEVRVTLLIKLGEVYTDLGRYPEAAELLEEAVELSRRWHGGDHPELATAVNDLAAVYHRMGELGGAEELYRESIDMRRRLGLEDDLAKPMNNLATALLEHGEPGEAASIYRQSLERRRAVLAATPASDSEHTARRANVATNLRSLATALQAAGDVDGAEPLLREALAVRRQIYGLDSPAVATVLVSLGRLQQVRGHLEEAGARFAEALAIRRAKLGDEHWHTALAKKDLAAVLLESGERETARVLLTQALATLYRVRPADDWNVADAESSLGVYLASRGRLDEAEVCLREAAETVERQRGSEDVYARAVRRRLVGFYASTGRSP